MLPIQLWVGIGFGVELGGVGREEGQITEMITNSHGILGKESDWSVYVNWPTNSF